MPWLETLDCFACGSQPPAQVYSILALELPHCLALNSPEAPEERLCGPSACGLRAVESWLKGWPWSRRPQKLGKYLFLGKLVLSFQNSV